VFHDAQSDRVQQVKFLTRAAAGSGSLTCEAASRM
jgi:16S rRNA G966 N2-methylase RsmD